MAVRSEIARTTETSSAETPSTEVKQYQREKLSAAIASLVISLVYLAVLALVVGPHIEGPIQAWVGGSRWLRLVVFAFAYVAGLEVLTLPSDFWSGYVLEHRHHLSNQSLGRWIWRHIKGYLVGGPIGLALLLGLYALIWYSGPWWWLWAAAGWLAATLVLGQLLPVVILPLFYKVTRLDDPGLLARLQRLAGGTGLNVEGIYRLHLSADTRKANAALAGLGRTRRVLLGDTLLERFTPEEIEVVFAHEVGHHVHRHLPKLIVLSVALATAGFWVVNLTLRSLATALGYTAFDAPAALALLILVLALFTLILSPVQNALSRFFERQCDWYALQRTGLVQAYRSAFQKLANMNKADPDPSPVVVWLFDDHPPIRQRLALADRVSPPQPDTAG
jgi:STE24 endopeptidase